MIQCGIQVNAYRPHEKTRQTEVRPVDIVDLTTEEFVQYMNGLSEQDKIIVAETLRRCLINSCDFSDDFFNGNGP